MSNEITYSINSHTNEAKLPTSLCPFFPCSSITPAPPEQLHNIVVFWMFPNVGQEPALGLKKTTQEPAFGVGRSEFTSMLDKYLPTSFTMDVSWGSCLAAHGKIFRYQLLMRFVSFFQTFLKWDNVLKTEGVRKRDLTWDLKKKQLCLLSSSGFLTTAVGNGPNWKLVQQSTVGHNLLAKGSLNQQWNLIWSGLSASLKDCQLQSVPATGRLTQTCAHYDSYWWSDIVPG